MAMETIQLYPWQEKAIEAYEGEGIIKAATGAGKSLAAKEIAKKIGGRILILSHSETLLDQWRSVMHDMDDVDYGMIQTLCKKPYDKKVKLLIVDEVDRTTSPVFIKAYDNIDYDNILGLSATPDDKAIEKCGDIIIDVKRDEANISPFIVKYHGIDLTYREMAEYKRLSYAIGKICRDDEPTQRKNIEALVFKRRGIVYEAENRMEKALFIIAKELCEDKKILIITRRKSQADNLSRMVNLFADNVVYHSDSGNKKERKAQLDRYRKGDVKILISVGMVKEGFDDVDTDCGIIVATPLTESFHIQTMGRIIRYKENKMATIHFLLANDTTDMKVLKHIDNYDFTFENIRMPKSIEHKKDYYDGQKYSFCERRVWMKNNNGRRINYEYHPILEELRKLKRSGGSFVINDGGVYMKIDGEFVKVSGEVPEFILKIERKLTEEKMSWEELMEGFY